jgi:hypothetical protein
MYRIAVIQNESEMLIAGYSNVVPKLRQLEGCSEYSFEMFNVVNIRRLFDAGDNSLDKFDSLFITTNATSDTEVLKCLRDNISHIEGFILAGKGIFIASQKKLSAPQLAHLLIIWG